MAIKQEWEHALTHPPDYGLDIDLPIRDGPGQRVHVKVPKQLAKNKLWRLRMLESASSNPARQRAIRAMCGAGLPGMLFWINLCAWTYQVKRVQEDGTEKPVMGPDQHQPFITWPVQDSAMSKLYDCIVNGKSVAIDKSRDMGATWLILAVFAWFWLFVPGSRFIVMSRTQDLVYKDGDPDSLFWKIEYLIQRLPPWMLPAGFSIDTQVSLMLRNPANGNTIVGRSTTAAQGAGSRVTAVMLDEAALVRELRSLWVSFRAATACTIVNSTPRGACFYSDLVLGGTIDVIELSWWDHPLKGRGRRKIIGEHGKVQITAPFYEAKKAEMVDPREIAQELDRDHMGAGRVLFPVPVLNRHKATNVRPPPIVGAIEFDGEGVEDRAIRDKLVDRFQFFDDDYGPWKLWVDVIQDFSGRWRPPQDRTYAIGCDVSLGTAASNSTACVIDVDTGEQVAEFASATKTPEEFARLMMIAGLWFGGSRGCAFLGWEANGVGNIVTTTVRRLAYPWVYFRVDNTTLSGGTPTEKYGWASTTQAKIDLLLEFSAAMSRDEFTPRSGILLEECRRYVWLESGAGVGPGQLEHESVNARATHGDRVIAAGIAKSIAKFAGRCRPPERVPSFGSPAYRAARARKRRA